jgi:hypothetical protein
MANKSGRGVYAITIEPLALKSLIGLLNALDKETANKVRDAAQPLSKRLAGQLYQFGAQSPTPQTKLVMESISTPRDRLIRVDIGGAKKVGRKYGGKASKSGKGNRVGQNSASAGALLWGSEFGSEPGVDSIGRTYTNRFKVGRSHTGYWIAPAVDFYIPVLAREYTEMIQAVIKESGLD